MLTKLNQTQARVVLRPTLDRVLNYWGANNARNYNIQNTIAIACSGRGGSTWLAEIIGTLPGYPIIWEPLHLGKNPDCQNHGFGWRTYIPHHTQNDARRDYLKKILTGENLSTQVVSSLAFHPSKFINFQGFAIKFVNASLLLSWMLKQFPIKGILMLRHPCAVVESQFRHSAWNHIISKNNITLPQKLVLDYPHLMEVFETIQTREEILAFDWAIKTYVPLIEPRLPSLYITAYEKIIQEREAELDRLFEFLNKTTPLKAFERLEKASKTTQKVSNITNNQNPLTGWKNKLTTKQIDNILNVVHQVGIEFYTDALIPDYEGIYRMANKDILAK